jgi:hypothetical protein
MPRKQASSIRLPRSLQVPSRILPCNTVAFPSEAQSRALRRILPFPVTLARHLTRRSFRHMQRKIVMIYPKLAVQNHSPVYAGPPDRRQTCVESGAKNPSTTSGHARDLIGPSADSLWTFGVAFVHKDFVGSKREISPNRACHLTRAVCLFAV